MSTHNIGLMKNWLKLFFDYHQISSNMHFYLFFCNLREFAIKYTVPNCFDLCLSTAFFLIAVYLICITIQEGEVANLPKAVLRPSHGESGKSLVSLK